MAFHIGITCDYLKIDACIMSACKYLESFGAVGGVGTGHIHSQESASKLKKIDGNNLLHFKMNACMMTYMLTFESYNILLGRDSIVSNSLWLRNKLKKKKLLS